MAEAKEDSSAPQALTLEQVCEALQTGDAQVLDLIERGELRAYAVGGSWRIDAEDLQAYRDGAKWAARLRQSARVVAMATMKGGAGRTTSVFALGHALSTHGLRVLLIDGDPQASLTILAGYDPRMIQWSVQGVLVRRVLGATDGAAGRVIVRLYEGLDLVPMARPMRVNDINLGLVADYMQIIEPVLHGLRDHYDVILIDYPPVRSPSALAALTIVDEVLIPMTPDNLALESLIDFVTLLNTIGPLYYKTVEYAGILLTSAHHQDARQRVLMRQAVQITGGEATVLGVVPFANVVASAAEAEQPVTLYAPDHRVSLAYAAIARRLMDRWRLPAGAVSRRSTGRIVTP